MSVVQRVARSVFLGVCSARTLHGADVDGCKLALSVVLSLPGLFQSVFAELTAFALVGADLCAASSVSHRAAVRSAVLMLLVRGHSAD